jgi:predicted Zn-dependent protease with MMP-like domain
VLTPEDFEDRARAVFDGIPPQFRARVDGPHVELEPRPSEHVPGSYVLGECHHHPDLIGDSPLHSSVVLYYGSFAALERRDPSFDVDDEIRETVLHEVQHHLEDAAGVDRLADLDWAEDQNDRRAQELPHDDLFWRAGQQLSEGVFRVGSDLFVEVEMREGEWRSAARDGLDVTLAGGHVRLDAGDFGPDGRVTAVFDWDWTQAPHELRGADGHDDGHGPRDTWGDLVIVARRRKSLLPALLGGGAAT